MRRSLAFGFAWAWLAFAPRLEAQSPTLELRSIRVGSAVRWYWLQAPIGAAGPAPLILAFHGGGGNARQLAGSNNLSALAAQHGYWIAWPEGTGALGGPPLFKLETWNAGNCCGWAMERSVDDVTFAAALIDELVGRFDVDPRRVYATGISNGGMMAYRLAIELPGKLAAIAPVAAALGISAPVPAPIALMVFHGLRDQNVPFEGGVGGGISGTDFLSQAASLQPFFHANQAVAAEGPCLRIGAALRFDAPAPATGADIAYWLLLDGGHTWPGAPAPSYNPSEPVNRDLDASAEMLDFFAAHLLQ